MRNQKIQKVQYEMAEKRIEKLLPQVNDNTPVNDPMSVELAMMSDIVEEYEKIHYPIGKPAPAVQLQTGFKERI